MQNYISVTESDPLRQGDMLSIRWDSRSTERQLAIILTADCDIAQDKMGAHYTLVGMMGVRDYVRSMWMKREIERRAAKELSEVCVLIQRAVPESDLEPINPSSLLEWLDIEDPEIISKKIAPQQHSDLSMRLKWLKEARVHCEDGRAIDKFYINMKLQKDRKKIESISKEIEASIKGMPSEYLFLPVAPDIESEGYVVVLRDIQAIPLNAVHRSVTQEKIAYSSGPSAHRIARLSAPLKYAMTQKFALLFSRIGLASDYEDERDIAAQVLAESLCRAE